MEGRILVHKFIKLLSKMIWLLQWDWTRSAILGHWRQFLGEISKNNKMVDNDVEYEGMKSAFILKIYVLSEHFISSYLGQNWSVSNRFYRLCLHNKKYFFINLLKKKWLF